MISQKTIDSIVVAAAKSDLARVVWRDRGRAPIGYVKGMAATFGLVLIKLRAGDPAAKAMVRIVDGPGDVFDHLAPELRAAGLKTDGASDEERLRALFVIETGLGMRESSGRYCEGRDRSASNTTADTAEAGLFQQSWDSRRASSEIKKLLDAYQHGSLPSYLDIFEEGVTPRPGDLQNYGSGDGAAFQATCKEDPAFAVQAAAIGLRTLYTHWGPIVRHEVEIRPEADGLFRSVQNIVDALEPSSGSVTKPAGKGWLAALIEVIGKWFAGKLVDAEGPLVKPPPTTKPADTIPWMAWAIREVGFHESGSNLNIGRYTGPGKCGSEGDPWCAIFVNAALESSGVRGSRSAMARSFETDNNFVRLDAPAYGAITTMWRGSKDSGKGHVFFYIGENDRGILALGGNQDDQVCRQYEPRNRVVGYWWPKSVPLPKVGKIIVDSDANEGSET